MSLSPSLLALLQRLDTPTVCNAIELAKCKRGFADFTRQTVLASAPQAAVGYARCARIAGAVEPTEARSVLSARRLAYYEHMAGGPGPRLAVVEDQDFPDCIGAWWGEVNTAVHKGLGLAGALTNGVMRDLGDLEPGFPVIAGSIGPSHRFVHVTDVGGPVEVFGLRIEDGDLVHADRHGALVIPPSVLGDLEEAVARLVAAEDLILGPARRADFDIEALRKAWGEFEKARV